MWVPGALVEAQSKLLEEKARGAQEMASELEVGAPGRVAVGLNRENWSFCWENVYLFSSSQTLGLSYKMWITEAYL